MEVGSRLRTLATFELTGFFSNSDKKGQCGSQLRFTDPLPETSRRHWQEGTSCQLIFYMDNEGVDDGDDDKFLRINQSCDTYFTSNLYLIVIYQLYLASVVHRRLARYLSWDRQRGWQVGFCHQKWYYLHVYRTPKWWEKISSNCPFKNSL